MSFGKSKTLYWHDILSTDFTSILISLILKYMYYNHHCLKKNISPFVSDAFVDLRKRGQVLRLQDELDFVNGSLCY